MLPSMLTVMLMRGLAVRTAAWQLELTNRCLGFLLMHQFIRPGLEVHTRPFIQTTMALEDTDKLRWRLFLNYLVLSSSCLSPSPPRDTDTRLGGVVCPFVLLVDLMAPAALPQIEPPIDDRAVKEWRA